MVEEKIIRVVSEDAQVGGVYNRKHEKSYGHWSVFRGLCEERKNGKAYYEMEVVQIVKAK